MLFGVLLLLCMNSLYSVDTNPLLDMWFANIFPIPRVAFHIVDGSRHYLIPAPFPRHPIVSTLFLVLIYRTMMFGES